jgi:hypothetical protein
MKPSRLLISFDEERFGPVIHFFNVWAHPYLKFAALYPRKAQTQQQRFQGIIIVMPVVRILFHALTVLKYGLQAQIGLCGIITTYEFVQIGNHDA